MPVKSKNDLVIPFTWEERKPVYLERFFYIPKRWISPDSQERIDWSSSLVFGNSRPVCIELCCGNGQWIGEKAKRHPEFNWVGVDLDFERARKAWLKLFREGISNLYIVCSEATLFLRDFVQPQSLDQSYVNFPDPWPKLRHAKHRLVQKPFLDALSAGLKPSAPAVFVTDDESYRDQILREVNRSPWVQTMRFPHYETDLSCYGDSYFASLWRQKGRSFYWMQVANG